MTAIATFNSAIDADLTLAEQPAGKRSVQVIGVALDEPASGAERLSFVVVDHDGKKTVTLLAPDADVNGAIASALAMGGHIVSVNPRRESLEDLFVREVESGDVGHGAESMRGN